MTATEIRAHVKVGTLWQVTNHYISREDHPCFGTRLTMVTKTTGSSFTLGDRDRVEWPRASETTIRNDGTILLFGGGAAQDNHDLWLSLTPIRNGLV